MMHTHIFNFMLLAPITCELGAAISAMSKSIDNGAKQDRAP